MYDQDTPVGFVGFNVDAGSGYAYLMRAGVLASHAGKGLYRRLVRAGLAYYRKQGVKFSVTDCTNWNIASARGLLAAGYKPYWPVVPWGFEYSIYWIRPL